MYASCNCMLDVRGAAWARDEGHRAGSQLAAVVVFARLL